MRTTNSSLNEKLLTHGVQEFQAALGWMPMLSIRKSWLKVPPTSRGCLPLIARQIGHTMHERHYEQRLTSKNVAFSEQPQITLKKKKAPTRAVLLMRLIEAKHCASRKYTAHRFVLPLTISH